MIGCQNTYKTYKKEIRTCPGLGQGQGNQI